jgi:hypothetical protein
MLIDLFFKNQVMRPITTLFIAGIALLSSCSESLSPYTSSVQQNASLGEAQLKQIQFYTSDDIVLQRNLGGSETTISGGELKIVNGKQVEEVRIAAGTPGVVVGMEGNMLFVSFDADGSFLRFGPNPGIGGRYTVMATDWDGSVGAVMYGAEKFWVVGQSKYAHLLLDMERIDSVTIQSKEASGRTLNP